MKKIIGYLMVSVFLFTACEKEQNISNNEAEENENIITTVLVTCSIMASTLLFTYIVKRKQQK